MAARLPEHKAKVWLLYFKHTRGDRGKLSLNILREICTFLYLILLADITKSSIRFFFQNMTWGQPINLSTRIRADTDSVWVILEDMRVFCCGGLNTNSAYLIDRGTVEPQPSMSSARYAHGTIGMMAVNAVYVFGGHNSTQLQSCEKLALGSPQWCTLPPMNKARYHFNPCLFGHLIYLCGSGRLVTMEAFDPDTDSFLPVHIDIHQQTSYNCCLYVHNDLLVLHQYSYIIKFAVEGGQLVKRSEVQSPPLDKWQNSQPVVASGRVFMVWKGKCVRFNMETGVQGPSVA